MTELSAIISAGVARYVESLPDFARPGVPQYFNEPVTDAEYQVELNLSAVDEDTQRALCLSCPLPDCVDVTDARCPIRQEQSRVWREKKRR